MTVVVVRPAVVGDAVGLADLNRDLQQVHVEAMPEEYVPYDRTAVLAHFRAALGPDAARLLWVAEEGGSLVGMVEAEMRSRPPGPFTAALTVLYVHALVVAPAARRRGVAGMLMDTVERAGQERGAAEVRLDHRAFNVAAHSFYRTAGYEPYNVSMRKPIA